MNIAAKLAENATSGALAMAKKPFECVRQVSMVGVNTVSDVGGYHEVSVGAVKFRTGDGGDIPDKKYVDVTANQSTAVADRCVAALMQQSRAGHVATDPLQEAMTVYKVTYPVLSEQIANPGVSTDYVVTSLSLPNVLRVKYEETCPDECPCPLYSKKKKPRAPSSDSNEDVLYEAEDDDEDGAGMGLSSAPAAAPLLRTYLVAPEYPEVDHHIMGPRDFEDKSKRLANALRYQELLPRDDLGAVQNEILADELGCSTEVLDQVVWSSQGAHDLRFERIEYGNLVTIRAKYKNANPPGPEFMSTEYNKEAARNVVLPESNGTCKNTLGIFNDLFPGEKFTFAFEKSGAEHCPVFRTKINYRVFAGEGTAATLQQSKSSAMGDLLAKMLVPSNETLEHAIVKIGRAHV